MLFPEQSLNEYVADATAVSASSAVTLIVCVGLFAFAYPFGVKLVMFGGVASFSIVMLYTVAVVSSVIVIVVLVSVVTVGALAWNSNTALFVFVSMLPSFHSAVVLECVVVHPV